MTEIQNLKQYDLEDRTLAFAKSVIQFCAKVPKTISNQEIIRQLVRAAGSPGANYIEANEALSKKDFVLRIRICRKESKECIYWLRLIDTGSSEEVENERHGLVQEATELMKIFSAILIKSTKQV